MNIKTQITQLHYNKQAKGFLFCILKFASIFYAAGSNLKNILYDKNILKPQKVNAYVIAVGNITTGGVGKTPVVAEIAKYLIAKGDKVAIISRGYGGKLSNKQVNLISNGEKVYYNALLAGDEPCWLAENTKAVVVTSKNRKAAADYAIKTFGVNKIILDDGFQHRKLHRDLDIVLCDSEKQLGNTCQLPAGPLRESKKNLARADRIVIVSKNTEHSSAEKLADKISNEIGIKTLICKTEPDYVYNIKDNRKLENSEQAVAISAIGQPEQFYKFLRDYNITNTITYDDHHRYTKDEISNIKNTIITTEKDAVKMKQFDMNNIYALKLKTDINVSELLS